MLSHGESYHSHKYGYDTVGSDVYVTDARMKDRNRHLHLLRQKEDSFWQNIDRIMKDGDTDDLHSSSLNYPDCIILTPTLMASFPRAAALEISGGSAYWDKETELNHGGNLVRGWYIPQQNNAPFGVHITVNHHFFSSENQTSFNTQRRAMEAQSKKEIDIISAHMGEIASYVIKLNKSYGAVSLKKAA